MIKWLIAVSLTLAFFLSPNAEGSGPSESGADPLVGSWRIERSVPYTTHESFVFSDDDSLVILDAQATVIERQVLTQRTENSFVGTITFVGRNHRLPSIVGTPVFAEFERTDEDNLTIRFYDNDSLKVLYVTFYLVRSEEAITPQIEAMPPEEDFSADIVIDFNRRLPDDEFFRNGGRLEMVRRPGINKSTMGLIDIPESVPGLGARQQPKASTLRPQNWRIPKVPSISAGSSVRTWC